MSADYCLKWKDHHNTFFSSVERLCSLDVLTDVTLSCGNKEFPAHKLVLSVCSGYFHHIFGRNRTKALQDTRNAIVYLKDVSPKHMEMLLNYMYRGEVNVEEHELNDLLVTAKSLQVRGLGDPPSGPPGAPGVPSGTKVTSSVSKAKTISIKREVDTSATSTPAKRAKTWEEQGDDFEEFEDEEYQPAPEGDDEVYEDPQTVGGNKIF